MFRAEVKHLNHSATSPPLQTIHQPWPSLQSFDSKLTVHIQSPTVEAWSSSPPAVLFQCCQLEEGFCYCPVARRHVKTFLGCTSCLPGFIQQPPGNIDAALDPGRAARSAQVCTHSVWVVAMAGGLLPKLLVGKAGKSRQILVRWKTAHRDTRKE